MDKIIRVKPETGLDEYGGDSTRKKIMSILPFSFLVWLRSRKYRKKLKKCYEYDIAVLEKYSSIMLMGDTRDKLQGLVTLAYHNIEKGLSLKNPRPMFGRAAITRLISRLDRYVKAFGWDELAEVALNVLQQYRQYNLKFNEDDPELDQALEAFSHQPSHDKGGTKSLTKESIWKYSKIDLENFFKYRSSIRNYSNQSVSRTDIEKAVQMAQKTPSVCNRQTGRVIAVDEPNKVQEMLKLQGGARGFGEQVPCLLVIPRDLSKFQGTGERYQFWIDGGLFAMSVIYALHSLGLGTCCLNWSKDPQVDKLFYEMFPEYKSERVIMFLAVGHLPDKLNAPQSSSPLLNEVLRWED